MTWVVRGLDDIQLPPSLPQEKEHHVCIRSAASWSYLLRFGNRTWSPGVTTSWGFSSRICVSPRCRATREPGQGLAKEISLWMPALGNSSSSKWAQGPAEGGLGLSALSCGSHPRTVSIPDVRAGLNTRFLAVSEATPNSRCHVYLRPRVATDCVLQQHFIFYWSVLIWYIFGVTEFLFALECPIISSSCGSFTVGVSKSRVQSCLKQLESPFLGVF